MVDGWLVHDPHGAVAGYGWARRKGDSDEIDVDAIGSDDVVSGWLWDEIIGRAGELAAELGHDDVKLDVCEHAGEEFASRAG